MGTESFGRQSDGPVIWKEMHGLSGNEVSMLEVTPVRCSLDAFQPKSTIHAGKPERQQDDSSNFHLVHTDLEYDGTLLPSLSRYPPNTTTRMLPYLQKDFPKINYPVFGTARYCTMRSVYRGKDEHRKRAISLEPISEIKPEVRPDNKKIADVKLPEIHLEVVSPASDQKLNNVDCNGFIKTCKRQFTLRGLKYNQIFSLHRNKAEKNLFSTPEPIQRKNKKTRLPFISNDNDKKFLDELNQSDTQLSSSTQCSQADSGINLEREETHLEKRVREVVRGYEMEANGKRKPEKHHRRLGNIVSSRRLAQLLENGKPLQMQNFYNFYP